MTDGMGTLDDAIAWARDHWVLPEAPARIHQHAVEPDSALGSPKMSPAFLRYLEGSRTATTWQRITEPCFHATGLVADCCGGVGYMTRDRERYVYPMAAALAALAKLPQKGLNPHPLELVVVLAHAGWSVTAAAALCGVHIVSADHAQTVDAMFLLALRKLRGRYASGPLPRPKWTDLSESQRNAQDAA